MEIDFIRYFQYAGNMYIIEFNKIMWNVLGLVFTKKNNLKTNRINLIVLSKVHGKFINFKI